MTCKSASVTLKTAHDGAATVYVVTQVVNAITPTPGDVLTADQVLTLIQAPRVRITIKQGGPKP